MSAMNRRGEGNRGTGRGMGVGDVYDMLRHDTHDLDMEKMMDTI